MEQMLSLLIPGLVVIGIFLGGLLIGRRLINIPPAPEDVLADARTDAQRILARAEEDARMLADTYRDREDATLEHRRVEMNSKNSTLEQRAATLEQRAANLAQREELLIDTERVTKEAATEAARSQEEARLELEALAGFDSSAAKEELLQKVEDEARRDAMILVRDIETRAREEAARRSRRILAGVIQRLASEVVSETTMSTVPLPSDEMKGRIIGRDGRNIRTFEAVAGVDLIVDDTPEAVSVSTFDPVRREIARLALTRLVEDGRIHPTSIEEACAKAKDEVEQSIKDAGEWAMLDVGLTRIHPELVTLLGRLKYRTSYGQNGGSGRRPPSCTLSRLTTTKLSPGRSLRCWYRQQTLYRLRALEHGVRHSIHTYEGLSASRPLPWTLTVLNECSLSRPEERSVSLSTLVPLTTWPPSPLRDP